MIESTHEETLLLSYANRASSYDECTSKDSFIAAIKEHPNLNESFEEQLHKNADWEKRAKKEVYFILNLPESWKNILFLHSTRIRLGLIGQDSKPTISIDLY